MARASLPALVVVAASAGTAAAAAGAFQGTTSEHSRVTMTVSKAHHAITSFKAQVGYNGKCGQGGGPVFNADLSRMAIGSGGRFSGRLTLRTTSHIEYPGRVFGTVKAREVTGTIEQFLHGKPNRCYVETFTAKAG